MKILAQSLALVYMLAAMWQIFLTHFDRATLLLLLACFVLLEFIASRKAP